MPTVAGTGQSSEAVANVAAREALRGALRGLRGAKALFGLVFASGKKRLKVALEVAETEAPGATFFGCTTAGEVTERGLTRGGVAVIVFASDQLDVVLREAWEIKNDVSRAAGELCQGFDDAAREARGKRPHSTTVTLVDGLSGVGERLVSGILERTRAYQQIVGGAAADDGEFSSTTVGTVKACAAEGAVAAHFFGTSPWGVGVGHGLRSVTKKMTVTKAIANRVYTIDDVPAFEVYRKFARERGVTLTQHDAGPFLIRNELGVYYLDSVHHARAPLSVEPDGSLLCAADVPQGSSVCILDGQQTSMAKAARAAAEEAKARLEGRPAAAVLLFDCVCRGIIFDKEFEQEMGAIRSVFPDVPIGGFLTYGEIARFRGGLEGWHNATAVIVAVPR
jgi:hypothetical protein